MFVHHVTLSSSDYVPLCSSAMFIFLSPTMILYGCLPSSSIFVWLCSSIFFHHVGLFLANNVPLCSITMFVFFRPNLFLYIRPLWRKTLLFYVSSDLLKYRSYYTSVCTSSYARTRITLAKVRWNGYCTENHAKTSIQYFSPSSVTAHLNSTSKCCYWKRQKESPAERHGQ